MHGIEISYDEQLRVMEVYKQYGTYKKTALILNMPYWRVSKIIYRLEGRCDCGRPTLEDRTTCEVCSGRASRSKKRKYNERKEQGLCVQCGQPRGDSPSTVYCTEHNEHERLMGRFRRRERRKLNLCIDCGILLDSDHPSYCAKHALQDRKKKFQERNKRDFGDLYEEVVQRDDGKCVICGGNEPRTEVHHKKKGDGNTMENLDTLCLRCHHALTDLYSCPNPQAVFDYYLKHPEN